MEESNLRSQIIQPLALGLGPQSSIVGLQPSISELAPTLTEASVRSSRDDSDPNLAHDSHINSVPSSPY
jgi:hypothetical protein